MSKLRKGWLIEVNIPPRGNVEAYISVFTARNAKYHIKGFPHQPLSHYTNLWKIVKGVAQTCQINILIKWQREEVKQLTIRLSWRISRETFNGRSFESTTPFTKLKYLGNWPDSQFSIIRYQIYLVLNLISTNHEEWLMCEEHTNSPSKSSDMNTRLTYSLIFLVFLLSVISSFLVAGTKRIDLNSTSPCVK